MLMKSFARQMTMMTGLALSASLPAAALGSEIASERTAEATIQDRHGNTVGKTTLHQTPNRVLLHASFAGLPAGVHGFHLHATGTCEPPFKSAGGHFNPRGSAHGLLVEEGPHAGDMPNIHVPESGELELEVLTLVDRLEDLLDADGAALVIHEGADDYESQPSGAAGSRIACGVVEVK